MPLVISSSLFVDVEKQILMRLSQTPQYLYPTHQSVFSGGTNVRRIEVRLSHTCREIANAKGTVAPVAVKPAEQVECYSHNE